jgi:uncharacterized surface protein with fasciclin (FAS1) repeats
MKRTPLVLGASMALALGTGASLAGGLAATASASTHLSAAARPAKMEFGPACSAVPARGAGSFAGMTKAPVATAASANPVLTTLVTAVKKAGLVDTLNNAKALTVFAPDNAAFAKLPKAALDKLLANKMQLTGVLEYHVVAGRIAPARLAGKHTTLEGKTLTVTGSGTSFTVNKSASVVCGNVQTANATVYIIGSVLSPPKS